jgi:hypothetical protein
VCVIQGVLVIFVKGMQQYVVVSRYVSASAYIFTAFIYDGEIKQNLAAKTHRQQKSRRINMRPSRTTNHRPAHSSSSS